jgi:hypothetical protein
MKTAIAFLVLAVAVLCSFAYSQNAGLQQQQKEVKQLQAKLDAISKTAPIELREKCARQAREEFKLYGWDKEAMAGVLNHYDLKLDKCFMMIQSADAKSVRGTIITSKNLYDAFEGKEYGSYIWSTQKDKKYWEVPPLACKVTLPSGQEKVCHSSDEFDELVKQYME